MPMVYGNIFEDDLLKIVSEKEFQKMWGITKDKIDVCKVCEFRDICTDCRAFTESAEDQLLSKPLKCGYDPYKGLWEKWEKDPIKELRYKQLCNKL